MTDSLSTISPSADSWWNIAETLKGIHTVIQDDGSLLYSLLGIVIGGMITLSGIFITRTTSARQERKALKGILEDLHRHFRANLLELDRIELDKGVPSRVYFGRCRVDNASVVFHQGICNSIKRKHLKEFNRLRLRYRNGNIDLDVICEYLVSDRYDEGVMRQYLDMLRVRQEKLRDRTWNFLLLMVDNRKEKIDTKDPDQRYEDIIYEITK